MGMWLPQGEPYIIRRFWTRKQAAAVVTRYKNDIDLGVVWLDGPLSADSLALQEAWLALGHEPRIWLETMGSFYPVLTWAAACGNMDLLPTVWAKLDDENKRQLRLHTPELYEILVYCYARLVIGRSSE